MNLRISVAGDIDEALRLLEGNYVASPQALARGRLHIALAAGALGLVVLWSTIGPGLGHPLVATGSLCAVGALVTYLVGKFARLRRSRWVISPGEVAVFLDEHRVWSTPREAIGELMLAGAGGRPSILVVSAGAGRRAVVPVRACAALQKRLVGFRNRFSGAKPSVEQRA